MSYYSFTDLQCSGGDHILSTNLAPSTHQDDGGARSPARPSTRRQAEKEQRRRDLLSTAARLFSERGFGAVALDDIGSEVGVSGQAIYRHFSGKRDLLGALLREVSEQLLAGAQDIRGRRSPPLDTLEALVDFHVQFALTQPDIIRVQERDLPQLTEQDRRAVRRMQREYMEIWANIVSRVHPQMPTIELRTRLHGTFGLINSTAHSLTRAQAERTDPQGMTVIAQTLADMAHAGLRTRSQKHTQPL